jgi:YjbE family integral membrane protein
MEFLSVPWWSALMTIVLIDLVLAGDNAVVIALAARRLPPDLQRRAIFWGTFGAIGIRALMTLGVVWLLQIPGLMLVGGLGLLWIAYKLITDQEDQDESHVGAETFWGAMKTIVIADALMGVDNVLGIAGASHGSMDLVILGLLISVPIVVFGSQWVLKLIQRWPVIIQIGGAVLAWTAAQMIINEDLLAWLFEGTSWMQELSRWVTYGVCIAGVLGLGYLTSRRREKLVVSSI